MFIPTNITAIYIAPIIVVKSDAFSLNFKQTFSKFQSGIKESPRPFGLNLVLISSVQFSSAEFSPKERSQRVITKIIEERKGTYIVFPTFQKTLPRIKAAHNVKK